MVGASPIFIALVLGSACLVAGAMGKFGQGRGSACHDPNWCRCRSASALRARRLRPWRSERLTRMAPWCRIAVLLPARKSFSVRHGIASMCWTPPSSGDAVDGDELAATQHAALPAPIASRDHSRPHLRRTPWSSNLSPWVAPKHTLSRSPGDVPLVLRSQLQGRTWCPLSYRDGVDADQSSAAFETRR
jgi:hypothetical protein